jgi:hypothetical protein
MPGYKWLFDNEPLDISDIEENESNANAGSSILMLKLQMLKCNKFNLKN